jgi:hypothetical protein
LPAIVAVTVQVPAVDEVREPPDSAHVEAVPFATAYVTAPAVVPPEVVSVTAVPYVPEVEVSVSAAWFAFVTVTVPLTAVNE